MGILEGGVESGFRNVKPKDYKPCLLHVCGDKKHVQVYQVKLDAANLNNSDAFVLDCGLTLYQFNGGASSAWEKRKANAIVMECNEVCSGKLDKSKLDSNDVFILDGGGSVFIWVGKGANKAEKRDAMKYAVDYLTGQGRGATVPICRVMEGAEPKEFWNCFNGQAVAGRKAAGKAWKK